MHLNWLAKIELRGPGPPDRQIVVNYCFMRVLLYAKILREIKTEEAIGFFVTFLSLVVFHLGGHGSAGPPWLRLRVEVNCY